MKLLREKDYKGENAYPFPDEDKLTQRQREQPEYFVAACNAITSRFINNLCAIPYDTVVPGRRSIAELRLYRRGLQNPNKYKPFIIPFYKELGQQQNQQNSQRPQKTTVNISWDPLQILVEKMDTVMGYLQKINFDIETSAIDYEALINKKTMVAMAKLHADDRLKFMQDQVNEAAGRSILQDKDPSELPGGMKFNNPKEVDIAASVGVFFLKQEAAIQTLLTKSNEDSTANVINDHIRDDIATIAMSGKLTYTNQNTNIVVDDWIDMEFAMLPWSQYLDHRDMTWFGRVKTYPIGELRKKLKINEEELIKIAKTYSATSDGAPRYKDFYFNIQRTQNNLQFGMNMMDQIEVDVVECFWMGIKNKSITSVRNVNTGNLVINEVDTDYKLSDYSKKQGKELYQYKNMTVYKAKMVLGTNYVFDYGEDNDIAFKKSETGVMEPVFPVKVVRTGTMSLVERTIGFVDDACMANYKLRIARQKMPAPPNLYIDKSVLHNVQVDGVTKKPVELISLLTNEGFLIGDSKNQWGQNNQSGKAVQPIGTDMMAVLEGWVRDMTNSLAMIDKVTGINDIFAAQTPQRTTAVGVANNLIQGTQNSLTPLVKTFSYIEEQSARIKVKKWQIVAANMSEEQRKKLSINRALQTLEIGSDLNDYNFDIQIHASITDQEKAELLQDIKDMRNLRRQAGSGGINEADYMLLYNMIRTNKLVQAQIALASIIDARKKEDDQKQLELMQQNQNMQAQSNEAATQKEAQLMGNEKDLDLRNKLKEIQAKYQMEAINDRLRAIDDRRAKAMENIWGRHKQAS